MRSIATALVAACCSMASADHLTNFYADIDSLQSVPGSSSPAFGSLSGTYDSILNSFAFSWSVEGLLGAPSSPGAHIHLGQAGSTGPVLFGFNNPDGTWALSGFAVWEGLSSDDVDALFSEGLYANFHTDLFPAGEIRGQIRQVPTPGVGAVLAMAGMLGARRRR